MVTFLRRELSTTSRTNSKWQKNTILTSIGEFRSFQVVNLRLLPQKSRWLLRGHTSRLRDLSLFQTIESVHSVPIQTHLYEHKLLTENTPGSVRRTTKFVKQKLRDDLLHNAFHWPAEIGKAPLRNDCHTKVCRGSSHNWNCYTKNLLLWIPLLAALPYIVFHL